MLWVWDSAFVTHFQMTPLDRDHRSKYFALLMGRLGTRPGCTICRAPYKWKGRILVQKRRISAEYANHHWALCHCPMGLKFALQSARSCVRQVLGNVRGHCCPAPDSLSLSTGCELMYFNLHFTEEEMEPHNRITGAQRINAR